MFIQCYITQLSIGKVEVECVRGCDTRHERHVGVCSSSSNFGRLTQLLSAQRSLVDDNIPGECRHQTILQQIPSWRA